MTAAAVADISTTSITIIIHCWQMLNSTSVLVETEKLYQVLYTQFGCCIVVVIIVVALVAVIVVAVIAMRLMNDCVTFAIRYNLLRQYGQVS